VRFETLRHDQELVQGWGRGRLLVVRVGANLFAVAPYDDRGEPSARVLWSLSLLDSSVLMPEQIVVALPGPNEEAHRQVDPFGRAVGQVGPVRTSFLCYHESGRLVCLDTLTGRKRWERFDLPLDAVTFGDDEVVAVWSPANQRLEWLRAIDGATLGQRVWTAAPELVVLQRDRRAWWLSRTKPQRLFCEDAVSGTVAWTRELSPGSQVITLDARTLGVLEPQGVLHLLHADDGAPRGEPLTVELPPVLERVVVSRDPDRWYVAFSERTAQQAALRLNQSRQGYRVPIVTGPLYAIDQATGQVQWQVRLDREAWPVDQPKSLPVLVQAYQSFAGAGQPFANQPVTEGVLHLRDKRTGRDVLRRNDLGRLTYLSAWGDPDRGMVEVYLQNESLRLRYHPAPPAPDMPMP
jgi:outer membrane protein assembly factor BamB